MFLDPHDGPDTNDLNMWMPGKDSCHFRLDQCAKKPLENSNAAHIILEEIGDEFFSLYLAEHAAYSEFVKHHNKEDIVWKPAISGERELCDVCRTTVFNYHYICKECAFSACLDCYTERMNNKKNILNQYWLFNEMNFLGYAAALHHMFLQK